MESDECKRPQVDHRLLTDYLAEYPDDKSDDIQQLLCGVEWWALPSPNSISAMTPQLNFVRHYKGKDPDQK